MGILAEWFKEKFGLKANNCICGSNELVWVRVHPTSLFYGIRCVKCNHTSDSSSYESMALEKWNTSVKVDGHREFSSPVPVKKQQQKPS